MAREFTAAALRKATDDMLSRNAELAKRVKDTEARAQMAEAGAEAARAEATALKVSIIKAVQRADSSGLLPGGINWAPQPQAEDVSAQYMGATARLKKDQPQ